jgi:hypothetical protein
MYLRGMDCELDSADQKYVYNGTVTRVEGYVPVNAGGTCKEGERHGIEIMLLKM